MLKCNYKHSIIFFNIIEIFTWEFKNYFPYLYMYTKLKCVRICLIITEIP